MEYQKDKIRKIVKKNIFLSKAVRENILQNLDFFSEFQIISLEKEMQFLENLQHRFFAEMIEMDDKFFFKFQKFLTKNENPKQVSMAV